MLVNGILDIYFFFFFFFFLKLMNRKSSDEVYEGKVGGTRRRGGDEREGDVFAPLMQARKAVPRRNACFM